ncbi:hypothetical protein RA8CHR_02128 [Variovorax sp. RA8]|nr:hypothetical protein RA8CHR_02128 [Variovorax sp. RA8]
MRHRVLAFGWDSLGIGPLLLRCCWFEAGAGSSPRRASHFLCLAKESNQRKATPLRASLRFATGNLRCSLFAGSAQTRCAQTRAALIREKLRSSARAEGIWDGPSLRSATNGLAARGLELAHANTHELEHEHEHEHEHGHGHAHAHGRECQRQQRPEAHANPHPTQGRAMARWIPSPLWPRRGAQLFADKGPRVFEPEASLRGPREKRAPQVARSFAAGRGQWGRLFFGYFLLARQKKVTRLPGRRPGSCLKTSTPPKQANEHLYPSPEGKRTGRQANSQAVTW